jgi:spore coat polysaccharide biosynthesis protein SpsF
MISKKKLIAVLACRNDGTRLYGKPLQNLDVKKGLTILDYLIDNLKAVKFISDIVIAISEGVSNKVFIEYAKKNKLKYVIGDEIDVLSRLIKSGKKYNATDILRVSSESPFKYYKPLRKAWSNHSKRSYDFTTLVDVIDGIGFEILSMKALKYSHKHGNKRHKSELCSLYIRENITKFKCQKIIADKKFARSDLRLTVDYPEDLILCREIYEKFKHQAPKINIGNIINFLDKNVKLINLTKKYTEEGYSTMHIWNGK